MAKLTEIYTFPEGTTYQSSFISALKALDLADHSLSFKDIDGHSVEITFAYPLDHWGKQLNLVRALAEYNAGTYNREA